MSDLLGAGSAGLSSAEAAARLHRDGPNELPAPGRPSAPRRFVDELRHFFALTLWVASGLAFVAGLPQVGVAIIAVILLHALFSLALDRLIGLGVPALANAITGITVSIPGTHRLAIRSSGAGRPNGCAE